MDTMSENKNAKVAIGTLVQYYGSIKGLHGNYYVVTSHDKPLHSPEKYEDGVAYTLAPSDEKGNRIPQKFDGYETLSNARVTSFTPRTANPDRTQVD